MALAHAVNSEANLAEKQEPKEGEIVLAQNEKLEIEISHESHLLPTPEKYTHSWTVYVNSPNDQKKFERLVESITFNLHDSFAQPKRKVVSPPFKVSEQGWGSFLLIVEITLITGIKYHLKYILTLNSPGEPSIIRSKKFNINVNKSSKHTNKTSIKHEFSSAGNKTLKKVSSAKKTSAIQSNKLDENKFKDMFGSPIQMKKSTDGSTELLATSSVSDSENQCSGLNQQNSEIKLLWNDDNKLQRTTSNESQNEKDQKDHNLDSKDVDFYLQPKAIKIENHDDDESILLSIQSKIMSLDNTKLLSQVVHCVQASGARCQRNDDTFDFDLCDLDVSTLLKIKNILSI